MLVRTGPTQKDKEKDKDQIYKVRDKDKDWTYKGKYKDLKLVLRSRLNITDFNSMFEIPSM